MIENQIPISGIYINDILDLDFEIDKLWNKPDYSYITTPNPEIILHSTHDEEYQKALNLADLKLADGVGVVLGILFLYKKSIRRFTGVDATALLLKKANRDNSKVLIIQKFDALSKESDIKDFFSSKYPNCNPSVLSVKTNEINESSFHEKIKKRSPKLIICSMGFPYQELLAYKLKTVLKTPTIAIACGGAIDFLIGTQKRAPLFFREIGLEWLWRLFLQPWRMIRIFRAVILFPGLILFRRISSLFIYRKTVLACVINDKTEILLGFYNEPGEWAFPKGGAQKGESLSETALREIKEELGVKDTSLHHIYEEKNIFSYKWPKMHSVNRGYRGQNVSIVVFRFAGDTSSIYPDGYEASDFKWVYIDDIVSHLESKRQEMAFHVIKIAKKAISPNTTH